MSEAIQRTEKKAISLKKEIDKLDNSSDKDKNEKIQKITSELIKAESEAVQLKQQLQEINQMKMDNLVNGFKNVGDSFTKAGQALLPFSAAAAGILTGMAAIGKSTIDSADKLKTFADRVNLSAEELQKWQYIAMQTDVTNEELQAGLVKAQGAFASLAKGDLDVTSKALLDLGFTSSQAAQGMEANFEQMVHALSGIEDPMLQAAYANDIFGERMGAKLIPMLKAGGDGLAELAKEYENFDTLTNDQIDSLADFDNVLNNLKFSFKTIKDQIGMALLPVMESLAEMVNTNIVPVVRSLAEWFGNLSDKQKNVMIGVLGLVAALAPVLLIAGKLTSGIGSMIGMVGKLSGAFSMLAAHPIIAIIGVIAALFALLYSTNENFRNSINSLVQTLGSALMPILSMLGDYVNTLIKAFMPLINILGNLLAQNITYLIKAITPLLDIFTKVMIPVLGFIMKIMGEIVTFISDKLANAFTFMSKIITGIFTGIKNFIVDVIQFVEDTVNKAIDLINGLIRGINKIGSVLGFTLGEIENVKIQLETGKIPEPEVVATNTPTSVPVNQAINNNTTQQVTNNTVTYNNDSSQKDITINVTVENYAEELDYDDLAEKINLKLAEAF